PQITVVELIELGGDPTPEMNSVGDMPDGDLLNRNAGPKRLPHSPADLSVQLADAIAREAKRNASTVMQKSPLPWVRPRSRKSACDSPNWRAVSPKYRFIRSG